MRTSRIRFGSWWLYCVSSDLANFLIFQLRVVSGFYATNLKPVHKYFCPMFTLIWPKMEFLLTYTHQIGFWPCFAMIYLLIWLQQSLTYSCSKVSKDLLGSPFHCCLYFGRTLKSWQQISWWYLWVSRTKEHPFWEESISRRC